MLVCVLGRVREGVLSKSVWCSALSLRQQEGNTLVSFSWGRVDGDDLGDKQTTTSQQAKRKIGKKEDGSGIKAKRCMTPA